MQTDNGSTIDISWYDAIAAQVRVERRADDEGTVWVLFVDDDRRVYVGMAIGPGDDVGPREYDGLAHIIGDVDPPGVVIAITRDDGEPLAADWRLWEEMRGRLAASRCELIDVIIVGRHSWWAAVAGRPVA